MRNSLLHPQRRTATTTLTTHNMQQRRGGGDGSKCRIGAGHTFGTVKPVTRVGSARTEKDHDALRAQKRAALITLPYSSKIKAGPCSYYKLCQN